MGSRGRGSGSGRKLDTGIQIQTPVNLAPSEGRNDLPVRIQGLQLRYYVGTTVRVPSG
jgi:hypothetical protein